MKSSNGSLSVPQKRRERWNSLAAVESKGQTRPPPFRRGWRCRRSWRSPCWWPPGPGCRSWPRTFRSRCGRARAAAARSWPAQQQQHRPKFGWRKDLLPKQEQLGEPLEHNTHLEEGVADARHVVLGRVAGHDQVLEDAHQVGHHLQNQKKKKTNNWNAKFLRRRIASGHSSDPRSRLIRTKSSFSFILVCQLFHFMFPSQTLFYFDLDEDKKTSEFGFDWQRWSPWVAFRSADQLNKKRKENNTQHQPRGKSINGIKLVKRPRIEK